MEPLQWFSPRAPVTVAKCDGKFSFLTSSDLSAAFPTGNISVAPQLLRFPPSPLDAPSVSWVTLLISPPLNAGVPRNFVLGPLLFSQCPHLGMVWHIPVASTDTCQQPTLQKYSVSSLVLSFLSQTCSCHHPLDINGSWMLSLQAPQIQYTPKRTCDTEIQKDNQDQSHHCGPQALGLFLNPHSSGWPTPYWLTPSTCVLSRWERPCLWMVPSLSFLYQ